jgi:hypothetical protein
VSGAARAARAETLSARALGRATLARQLLLERSPTAPADALAQLVGLQAQVPHDPHTALWSRLAGFRPEQLSELLLERRAVRTVLMRGTIHLVTADDCLTLRPLVQPVLDRELARHAEYAPKLARVDLHEVAAFGAALLAEPHTGPELRAALAARFPHHDPAALALVCRNRLALVQVPPRGLWGRSAQPTLATAEAWLGRPLARRSSLDELVLRYLAAFGPASTADVSAWSGLTGLREVVERLRPRLRTFRTEGGRELFDLPDAPRPDAATPAPVRFLPEYDNLLLSHADRTRFVSARHRAALAQAEGPVRGTVLHDGVVAGVWRVERDHRDGDARLVVNTPALPRRALASIGAEARRLLRLLAADAAGQEVRLVALTG